MGTAVTCWVTANYTWLPVGPVQLNVTINDFAHKGILVYDRTMEDPISEEEMNYLTVIDEAVMAAAQLMDLVDALDEDDYEDLSDERFHCGTCVVRTVMETVWPSIEKYIEYCKSQDAQ